MIRISNHLHNHQLQIQRPYVAHRPFSTTQSDRLLVLPRYCIRFNPIIGPFGNGRFAAAIRCASEKSSDSFELNKPTDYAPEPTEILEQKKVSVLEVLKGANAILPHVVLASSVLALIYPPSFTWFTSRMHSCKFGSPFVSVAPSINSIEAIPLEASLQHCYELIARSTERYYAPALGFLMFAVGVNSSVKDFIEAFSRPGAIFVGYVGQFILKPLIGYLVGTIAVSSFGLPTSIGAGIMLTSCVSGAQLSNYATFLTDPTMAPLSIVMTSISTASAIFITPLLSLLLIGKRLPVDVKGMISSILQIVIAPIVGGLLLNRFFPRICDAIRPFLPPLSACVTALCVGAPLAINRESVMSPFGTTIVLLIIAFHLSAFVSGYALAGIFFHKETDVHALKRTISYETGMQSSLLALALANRFFRDPLVGVPPAISVVVMSLMGFSLVMIWGKKKEATMQSFTPGP